MSESLQIGNEFHGGTVAGDSPLAVRVDAVWRLRGRVGWVQYPQVLWCGPIIFSFAIQKQLSVSGIPNWG